jgi:hypothetical protein
VTTAPEPQPKKKESQATLISRLVVNLGVDLFHDAEQTPYATVPTGETYLLKSKTFQEWVQRAYYNDTRCAASASTLTDALALLSASARFSGPEREVFVRIAPTPDAVWLDLCPGFVQVTADGWRLEQTAPVRFLRPKGLLPLPRPVETPATQVIPLLKDLVNVTEADLPMVTAWLLGVLRGRSPFPVLILVGEQGTAKSFGSNMIRGILDPNVAPLRSTPREPRDLMIAARNSLVMAFDNLSTIPEWFSDDLCRLATGSGFATRELHTDADEILFRAARPIMFNSIADVARRADLLDRSMVVNLDPIPPEQRVTESTLYALFHRVHPALLGALLGAVSVALRHEATTKLPTMPRMADFAVWVEAAAPAFGWAPGAWLSAYADKRRAASDDLTNADLVVEAIQESNLPWEGPPTVLFRQLTTQERQRSKDWPQTPQSLSARLRRLAPSLRDLGISVTFPRRHHGRAVAIARLGTGVQPAFSDM